MLDLLRSPRFADLAPAEVYATPLDEGSYHCSIRTMYRILGANSEVRARRQQLRHPTYQKPELLAEAPNQVWPWDITKLMGSAKWSYSYLYVILDIPSRRVVGWQVADSESAALFNDTLAKHQVPPGQLTLHAARGGPVRDKATAFLLADRCLRQSICKAAGRTRPEAASPSRTAGRTPPTTTRSRKATSRPSNTSRRSGAASDTSRGPKAFCQAFFAWYNLYHHHAGLGLMTPDQVHPGQADAVHAARQATLDRAFAEHPERFVKQPPRPPQKPVAAWINPPQHQAKPAA